MTDHADAETIEMVLFLEQTTAGAIRVGDVHTKSVWLPKSQIAFQPDQPRIGMVTVTLPEWLAKDRGLI
ncbi:hypothetical protein GJ654_18620 [Rhodoblastus acidophilus]|uniref:Uncharacterized protein n=1 Tax=Rhodoblastus acidophilus TaxID=1074 RepID=A0A6N8DRR6_RHOAC|nr:hypothetical protein [Rhodoblastus acidophilus]MCW2276341.1 hypothetical protein [Rhodoblastus acidophilus]MTV32998.1 hypothetical protein [Rhodoblastus acidophilus]